MDSTRGHPHRRPCGGDTPATLERNRQAPRAVARQDGRAMIRRECAVPRIASGMEARRGETGGGFVRASASGSVHDSPAPADRRWLSRKRMLEDAQVDLRCGPMIGLMIRQNRAEEKAVSDFMRRSIMADFAATTPPLRWKETSTHNLVGAKV
jgi:hypothetical protein